MRGRFALLASDGVWDALTNEQVGERYFELKKYVTSSQEQREHTKTELLKERRTTAPQHLHKRHGGLLPYFIVYDAIVVLTLVLSMLVFQPLAHGYFMSWDNVMWGTSLYYAKFCYALSSAPYFIFIIPVIGPALHRAHPTGYDRSGHLVPKLSTALQKHKQKLDDPSVKWVATHWFEQWERFLEDKDIDYKRRAPRDALHVTLST